MALARLDCAVRYCFRFSGVEDGEEEKVCGRVIEGVVEEELLLSPEEELLPLRKPPKAMLVMEGWGMDGDLRVGAQSLHSSSSIYLFEDDMGANLSSNVPQQLM